MNKDRIECVMSEERGRKARNLTNLRRDNQKKWGVAGDISTVLSVEFYIRRLLSLI